MPSGVWEFTGKYTFKNTWEVHIPITKDDMFVEISGIRLMGPTRIDQGITAQVSKGTTSDWITSGYKQTAQYVEANGTQHDNVWNGLISIPVIDWVSFLPGEDNESLGQLWLPGVGESGTRFTCLTKCYAASYDRTNNFGTLINQVFSELADNASMTYLKLASTRIINSGNINVYERER